MRAVLQTFKADTLIRQEFIELINTHWFHRGSRKNRESTAVKPGRKIVPLDQASWSALALETSRRDSGTSGHICLTGLTALCGVEKRVPDKDLFEVCSGEEFDQWFKNNEPWICQVCVRKYKTMTNK